MFGVVKSFRFQLGVLGVFRVTGEAKLNVAEDEAFLCSSNSVDTKTLIKPLGTNNKPLNCLKSKALLDSSGLI